MGSQQCGDRGDPDHSCSVGRAAAAPVRPHMTAAKPQTRKHAADAPAGALQPALKSWMQDPRTWPSRREGVIGPSLLCAGGMTGARSSSGRSPC
ncbi:hypothetical protein Acsp04_40040 [Actinomadura sp. NBRC 104425]|nr:hypothetical protein Acsp04_40040 [Actinomadura sp. NBRC 104425]